MDQSSCESVSLDEQGRGACRQRERKQEALARTRECMALASASPNASSAHLPLLENQVSNVWSMGKDGRPYWLVKRQATTSDHIASHKGRNAHERASLKKRRLRK
ncbi:hypothetical protein [Delftia lacustris]|uniref:hypothetical protein n=1 Tax=Delftia lacustris TaxID=558537 RepID=UPI0035A5A85C